MATAKTTKTILKNKTQNVLTIDTTLINKEEVFRMLALAHATGMPLLLVGAPGTGKTKTVIDYAKSFLMQGVDQADPEAVKKAKSGFMDKIYMLETDEGTKSSEVKGMADFKALFTENRYEVIAPITEAEVVIINEVDKASSGIRNSLLGIMNEKMLFNGKTKIPCKWKLFIATCNEIPKEETGSPFWDRFILKMTVNRIMQGEMVKYYDKGAKNYKESLSINMPNKQELDTLTIPTSKLEKFLDVAYTSCSDRTLTFVPTLTKAVSYVWDATIDSALVKVASIMIGKDASTDLQNKLMSNEVKALMSKVQMLYSVNNEESIELALSEIEGLLTGYAANGKLDESQVLEIETSIQYVLEHHPVKQKGQDIENILQDAMADADADLNPF